MRLFLQMPHIYLTTPTSPRMYQTSREFRSFTVSIFIVSKITNQYYKLNVHSRICSFIGPIGTRYVIMFLLILLNEPNNITQIIIVFMTYNRTNKLALLKYHSLFLTRGKTSSGRSLESYALAPLSVLVIGEGRVWCI